MSKQTKTSNRRSAKAKPFTWKVSVKRRSRQRLPLGCSCGGK